MRRVGLVLATFLLQVVVGRDYYWLPDSNWNNVDNWGQGRVPCESDTASFASVPANSLIYLNANVTVRKIILPANGKLVLKPSITIVLSDSSACTVAGRSDPPPVASVPQVNRFVGAVSRSWECPQNWIRDDDLPAARPPCQDDNAIFKPDSAYSFVTSNQSISIRSLTVRGEEVNSLQDLADEFRIADFSVNPECGDFPNFCSCPSQENCQDVNECEVGLANCSTNGTCSNTPGSFECLCNPGYEGDGFTCTDIDECSQGDLDRCDQNAQCTNTDGSFECLCNPGYEGDGFMCTDIDECSQGDLDRCDQNAQCTNTDGSFECQCNPGFAGDGFMCTDIDECSQGDLDRCDQNAQCTNTDGSFECLCNPGFTGNGFTCTVVTVVSEGSSQGSNAGGVAAGVVVAVLVVIIGVIVAVGVGVILYMRHRRGSYIKDEALHPEDPVRYKSSQSKDVEDTVAFDNPLYDSTTGNVQVVGFQAEGEPPDDSNNKPKKLNEYERM